MMGCWCSRCLDAWLETPGWLGEGRVSEWWGGEDPDHIHDADVDADGDGDV
jgi:hypothetical protein